MLKAEDVFAERFVVERLAGTGGMGRVYRALDRVSGEQVALKVLLDPGGAERFAREARLLAELSHPSIVRYVAHGQTLEGETYIAMEWLEGETLSARLKREPLSTRESLELVMGVAEALAIAHERGIVHRDVKPANLLLVNGALDRVKVLDFGIAHLSDATAVVTRTGAVLGTLGYMAPEQARGERNPSVRADVFSLGCVLFHCLTGRPAFAGATPVAVLAKLILEEAPRLADSRPDLPPALDDVIARMLEKEPERRPANARAVLLELESIAEHTLDLPPPQVSSHADVLTGAEQRLVCVLLTSKVLPEGTNDLDAGATIASGDGVPTTVDGPAANAADATFRALRAVAGRHGAVIEPLRDGSVAVLLTGLAQGGAAATDLSARAARCALALRATLPAATIAVATGRGVVADRLPVGEVIETAARLVARERGASEPAVVLDRVTAGLLDVRFEVGGRGDGALLLRGERKLADATRKLLGSPTTTIGRERELGFLLGLFEEAITEPMARAAVVTGPAGIGKSRLRYEFLRRVEARAPAAEIWIARGDPIGAGSPFGLLSQVLRRAAGIFDGEPAAVSREKLTARVERNVAAPEADRVAAFLGEIARVPYPSEKRPELEAARRDVVLMGDQTRRAWTDFVAAECAKTPVVLVLEDLHWGDVPTVSFVDSALRAAEDLPLLVLALARPELFDHFGEPFKNRDPQQLKLGALTRKAAEKLVREVLGPKLDEAIVARIVERAEGNAFFLEELIRSVAEGEGDALPETLVAMVQARLEALPDGARRVLRAASLFGGVFWDSAVAAMTGQDLEAGAVADWLRLLGERELIVPRAQSRFPGIRELVFRHALVREAAYEMLTPSDRELGHRLAGTWLEDNGEPDAMVLAEHFASGAAPERAFRWYRVAAEEALDAPDFSLAIHAVERAVAIGGGAATPHTLGELERVRAEAHYWRGEHPEAHASAERALELLDPGSHAWYMAAAVYCTASNRVGGVDGAARLARQILDAGWAARPSASAVIGCTRVAVVLIQSGYYQLADEVLAQIEPNLEALVDDPAALSRWQASLAARALYTGKTGDYLVLSELAVESSRRAGDLRNAAIQRHNLGHANLELGRYAEAERHLRAISMEAERLGLANVVASAKNNLGYAMACQGRFADARTMLEQAIRELEEQSDRRMLGGACNHLAQVLFEIGDLDAAEPIARRAVDALELFLPLLCQARGTLSRILLAKREIDSAVALASEAVALLDDLGSMADGEIGVRLAHAEALDAAGSPEAAREALAIARRRLLARADAIDDEGSKSSFLTRVRDNARVLELASAWLPAQSG